MRESSFRTVFLALITLAVIMTPALAQEKGDNTPPGPGIPAPVTGGPDAFGYTFFDQAEVECTTAFTDISATGTPLTYTASGGFPPEDDGGVVVTLGAPFDFYGSMVTDMVVSSNGYLAMGAASLAAEAGGDFSNDCPIPAVPGTMPFVSSRIMPYHDDLAGDGTGGTTFYEFFPVCPRAGESGGIEPCSIVMWQNWGFFGGAVGFDLEVILYHTSFEIAVEIDDPSLVADGGGATVGIQDGSGAVGLMYQCDTASIGTSATVCNFHPSFPPGSLAGGGLPIPTVSSAGLVLLASVLALGGLFFMMRRRRTA